MRFNIYVFFIQFIAFCNQCRLTIGKPLIGENVRKALLNEFISTVSIHYINANNPTPETNHDCTGVLISRKNVLTAAHCFKKYKLANVEIIAGSNDLRGGLKFHPLWWITYDKWAREKGLRRRYRENDIGIIRLSMIVPVFIYPIILSTMSSESYYGAIALAAGWGKTLNGETPRLMETVELTILSKTECENKIEEQYGSRIIIDERYLCSFADPHAILSSGDSGGPLMRMGSLIGINKSTCPYPDIEFHPKKVNIHFSVFFYKDFILDIKNNYH